MQVVSAMEAVGVMELLTKFNSKPQNAKVGRRACRRTAILAALEIAVSLQMQPLHTNAGTSSACCCFVLCCCWWAAAARQACCAGSRTLRGICICGGA